jgi:hypothetical protein
MRRPAVVAVVLVVAAACGGASPKGGDPVATAEEPAAVLANSQYPELPADALRNRWLVDTGEHLTHVLSFVDGLAIDEAAAADGLRYFEHLNEDVDLGVAGEEVTLTYRVRPRNYPQRYVVVVGDGAPLPRWAGRPEEGRSFAATRPVNVDHAVTVIRLAAKPFALGPPFESTPPAAQLDNVFLNAACARSTSIVTDADAAYRYGANIHNQGEAVICAIETRQLAGRQLAMPAATIADAAAATRVTPGPGQGRGPSLVSPPFDAARYNSLPKLRPIFSLG